MENIDLSQLPPQYVAISIAICSFLYLLGVLAAIVKHFMGDPAPETDSRLRAFVFEVLRVIDVVAANSTTIRTKLVIAQKDAELRAAHGLPDKPASTPPPGVVVDPGEQQ